MNRTRTHGSSLLFSDSVELASGLHGRRPVNTTVAPRPLRIRWTGVGAAVVLGLAVGACSRCSALAEERLGTQKHKREPELPAINIGPAALSLAPVSQGKYRLLLDEPTLKRLRHAAETKTATFQRVEARCREFLEKDIAAGYQAFDWGDAMSELTLCWHATGEERYSTRALHYLEALLDDRSRIGDDKGGLPAVQADSGYGVRTYAAYPALAYDWLRHAPGMTPALRQRIITRLDESLGWYAQKGYLNDTPISNYFWGYLTALTFAGLAVGDDAPQAGTWLKHARELLGKRVLPTFKAKLKGGDWPEGWQYGELVAAEAALLTRAYKTAAGVDLRANFRWLGEVVDHHVHALLPDGKSVYGGGTWGERPSKPSALALSALAWALEGHDDDRAAQARFLVRNALPPLERSWLWLRFLTENSAAAERDPRSPAKTSYLAEGSGLALLRSDWSPSAVFTSLKIGPRLAVDHQDKDDGHFELWRGSDALLTDAGDSEGEATINHNTLLIDDGGRMLTYTPNQGVWGKTQKMQSFGDDGRVAVASGEFADAYAPKCARDGCSDRAIEQLGRTLVFVRPSLVVIYDRVKLQQGGDGVTWAAHLTVEPERAGKRTSAVIGSSRVDVHALLPERAKIEVRKEPTPSGDGPHRANRVWGPMWRLEVQSPRGSDERGFVTWITPSAAADAPSSVDVVRGDGVVGGRAVVDGRDVTVVFLERESGGTAKLGRAAPTELVVAGVKPGKSYAVSTRNGSGCELDIRAGEGAARAGAAAVLRSEVCR